jgi:PAS domain S-box-containing protein
MDLRQCRADGHWRWFRVRSRPSRQADGSLLWEGISTDVTEEVLGRLALVESEARLRILGDQLPDSFLYQLAADTEGRSRFLYLSAGVERLCGLKAEDVLRDPGLLFAQMDAQTLQRYLAEEAACAEALRPFAMDLRQRRADGHWRWFRVRSRPSRQADGSLLWEGIATDVTEEVMGRLALAESETRFRQLADTAPAFIWMTDAAGSCTYFSQGWTAWTGRPVEEAQGEGCTGFIHPEDLPGCLAISDRAFQAREPYAVEFRLRHHSGAYRWTSDHAQPRLAEDGTFLGYIGVGIDIQDMKEAEATSRESEHRAKKAESLVLMAGGIAHDFNNIFQGVLGFLDIANAKAGENAGLGQIIAKAKTALRKAIQLSWKMLDFSGRSLLKAEPLELELWLPAFLATLQLHLPPEVHLVLSAEPVPAILGDRFKLEEVVKATVANAVEALGSGGGWIRLRLHPDFGEDSPGPGSPGLWPLARPEGPASVCIEIADDGPGVPPDLLSLICDPFFTTREQGRGLGLAVVVGILGAHRAGFHVFNGEGGGLVQRIHFPPTGL